MMANAKAIPPRNGEGDRKAVEGPVEAGFSRLHVCAAQPDPSVSPADCHLPVPGRIFAAEAL